MITRESTLMINEGEGTVMITRRGYANDYEGRVR